MSTANKYTRKISMVILTVFSGVIIASSAWAAVSLIDGDHLQTDAQITRAEITFDNNKPKSRAPEPSTLALFGSGIFGMVVSMVRRTYRAAKRGFDIACSIAALIILSPAFLLVALLIKLSSKGPIIYTQIRVGKDGKLFKIYKFRSMKVDAEKYSGAVWAQDNDPRLIPVGRFLRKSHLDEIPQFVNVLKGDMSVVGPRPERPEFVQQLKEKIPGYEQRLSVKPGITGLAQVWHRYDASIDDVKKKIKYDLLYIKNLCLWTDVRIFLRTFRVVVTGEGAH